MTKTIGDLKAAAASAEEAAHKIQAEKDAALAKVMDKYGPKLVAANQKAADTQKAVNDAEAVMALVGRPDGLKLAQDLELVEAGEALGLVFPNEDDMVIALPEDRPQG